MTVGAYTPNLQLPDAPCELKSMVIRRNGTPCPPRGLTATVQDARKRQVSAMLAILARVGRGESRFRMPRADGSLVEFDSYTEVDGESYTTVIRPRA